MKQTKQMKQMKTIAKEATDIQSIKSRIDRRAVVIGSLIEETIVLRNQNRNDYLTIKRLQQLV